MSKYPDFREFYEKELRPDLEIIDQKRKEVRMRVITILLIIAALITGEILLIPDNHETLKGIVPVITGVFGIIFIGVFSKSYRQEYKNKIIARIANYVDEGLIYSPDGSVAKLEFEKSEIFSMSCDRFKGEDHFRRARCSPN